MHAVVNAKVEAEVGVALTNHATSHQPETPVTVPPGHMEKQHIQGAASTCCA